MRSIVNNVVKIMATGFVVLTLLSLVLFWSRWLCERYLANTIPPDARRVRIEPSLLVPFSLELDPNVVHQSCAEARMNLPAVCLLGVVDYFAARLPGGRRSNIYDYDPDDKEWMYFDQKFGLIVCQYSFKERMPDSSMLSRKVQLYAGPEGVSETAGKALGRFISPIIDPRRMDPLILYDRKLRRFFRIDLGEKTIVKGPELDRHDSRKPTQIGQISKNGAWTHLHWRGPQIGLTDAGMKKERHLPSHFKSLAPRSYRNEAGHYLLVLDETGRIDLVDKNRLEFVGVGGHLPAPSPLFPSRQYLTPRAPRDLLAYEALPMAFGTDHEYRGIFVAGVCREGIAMALNGFDEEGQTSYGQWLRFRHTASVLRIPWVPALTIAKFLLESLHPPILSLVSYFTAYSFEAGAGHRALFILPNSFVAMKGRDVRQDALSRLGYALLLMLPSLILGIFLAWRIEKDGTVVGLSGNARLCWMIGAIVFGLAGYITYRLTRPKETLVTCDNCGKLRRPDMDRCHRCGSKWHVPEITPPTWRVIDSV